MLTETAFILFCVTFTGIMLAVLIVCGVAAYLDQPSVKHEREQRRRHRARMRRAREHQQYRATLRSGSH